MENYVFIFPRQDDVLARDLLSRLQETPVQDHIPISSKEFDTSTLHDVAARIYASRRERRHFFAENLFSDPAWDMLLALYCEWGSGRRVSVTSLAYSAEVPATTGLRWVRILEEAGLIERYRDRSDGRRVHLGLTTQGRERIERYLARTATLCFSSPVGA